MKKIVVLTLSLLSITTTQINGYGMHSRDYMDNIHNDISTMSSSEIKFAMITSVGVFVFAGCFARFLDSKYSSPDYWRRSMCCSRPRNTNTVRQLTNSPEEPPANSTT